MLPRNNINLIRRVMLHFGLDAGSYVTIIPNRGSHTHLPTDEPAPLLGILGSCVELQDPATRSDIEVMARYTSDPEQRSSLEGLVGTDDESQTRFRNDVLARGRSLLDLLEDYPACDMPFEVFLDRLPPLLAPLLLNLLLAHGQPRHVQRYHRSIARAGALRDRRVRWSLLELPGIERPEQHSVRLRTRADHRLPAAG